MQNTWHTIGIGSKEVSFFPIKELKPFTLRVKPWVKQFSNFFMHRTPKCDHSLYSTVVLFVFQFYPVRNFGKCINFGLGAERVNV